MGTRAEGWRERDITLHDLSQRLIFIPGQSRFFSLLTLPRKRKQNRAKKWPTTTTTPSKYSTQRKTPFGSQRPRISSPKRSPARNRRPRKIRRHFKGSRLCQLADSRLDPHRNHQGQWYLLHSTNSSAANSSSMFVPSPIRTMTGSSCSPPVPPSQARTLSTKTPKSFSKPLLEGEGPCRPYLWKWILRWCLDALLPQHVRLPWATCVCQPNGHTRRGDQESSLSWSSCQKHEQEGHNYLSLAVWFAAAPRSRASRQRVAFTLSMPLVHRVTCFSRRAAS